MILYYTTTLHYTTPHYTTHHITLHYTTRTLTLHLHLHYTTLTLPALTLHTTPHYNTLHYTTLCTLNTTPQHTTLHYTTLHTTLQCTTLHYTAHYTALHCTALHCTALLCTARLHCTTLHYTTLTYTYTTLHYTTLHYTTLHYITIHNIYAMLYNRVLHCTSCTHDECFCNMQSNAPAHSLWTKVFLYVKTRHSRIKTVAVLCFTLIRASVSIGSALNKESGTNYVSVAVLDWLLTHLTQEIGCSTTKQKINKHKNRLLFPPDIWYIEWHRWNAQWPFIKSKTVPQSWGLFFKRTLF